MGLTASTEIPPFSLTQPKYDQTTFDGRVRHFREITDWRTLFTTSEQLQDSLTLLDQFKNGLIVGCLLSLCFFDLSSPSPSVDRRKIACRNIVYGALACAQDQGGNHPP